jgi:UDP-GlcNAc:undecaprenyl-phosphate GlcNAc-1-phosphate transferase
LILGVPIIDVIFAIFRRTLSGKGLATADRGHLHHRLIALGHGPRRAVVILWLWTGLFSAFALYPALTNKNPNLWLVLLAAVLLIGFSIFHPRLVRHRESITTQ